MGSEMCIRDSSLPLLRQLATAKDDLKIAFDELTMEARMEISKDCLLYTSDAADDSLRVDLGGRRIIKKIFFKQKTAYEM